MRARACAARRTTVPDSRPDPDRYARAGDGWVNVGPDAAGLLYLSDVIREADAIVREEDEPDPAAVAVLREQEEDQELDEWDRNARRCRGE